MKRLILFFITILFSLGLCAQNSAYGKQIHQDYGTFRLPNGSNIVSISGFVTVEEVDPATHHDNTQQLEYKAFNQSKKEIAEEPKVLYHFEVYLVSKSVYEGDTTSTWLSGVRVFINGVDIMEDQFPNGFIVSVKTIPTLIYTHDAETLKTYFEVKWEKSSYEPRIRK